MGLYHLIVHLKSGCTENPRRVWEARLLPVDQWHSTLKVPFANVTLGRNLIPTGMYTYFTTLFALDRVHHYLTENMN